jgi:hypothetical protein
MSFRSGIGTRLALNAFQPFLVTHLRDAFKYLFNLTGEIDEEKARSWVQVIFAFIIDHTDEVRLRRRCIRKNLIDFSRRQEVWVITLDADRKFSLTLCSTHIQSRNRLMRIFFRPTPCASNQCNSAIRLVPSGRRTRPLPFSFLHRPRPNRFTRSFRIRTPVPTAIGSISVISPIISTCTAYYRQNPVECKGCWNPFERSSSRGLCPRQLLTVPFSLQWLLSNLNAALIIVWTLLRFNTERYIGRLIV